MTTLSGLTSRCTRPSRGEVVQGGGDVHAQRQQLLERERPVALEQRLAGSGPRGARSAGAGSGPRSPRRSRARPPGARAAASSSRLAAELAHRGRLLGQVGPQHLGHQHGQPVVVPHEEDLEAAARRPGAAAPCARRRSRRPPRAPRSAATASLPRRRLGHRLQRADGLAAGLAALVLVVGRREPGLRARQRGRGLVGRLGCERGDGASQLSGAAIASASTAASRDQPPAERAAALARAASSSPSARNACARRWGSERASEVSTAGRGEGRRGAWRVISPRRAPF